LAQSDVTEIELNALWVFKLNADPVLFPPNNMARQLKTVFRNCQYETLRNRDRVLDD